MKESVKKGVGFGMTSGIITTLGLMVGLNAGTGLRLAIIGGIMTVAIADAFSDSLGIHMSEETSNKITHKEVWESTVSAFLTKLIIASTFIVPVLIFPLDIGVKINLAWGLFLLIIFNYILAKMKKEKPLQLIINHVTIAAIVIIITYYIGLGIKSWFG